MGTFSFYFSHHISTIEGGMLVTDDPVLADLARTLRAHGWIRDVKRRPIITDAPIDERFLFVNIGYNLWPTELQGAFGIHQMPKLEPYIKIRRDNVEHWNVALRRHARWLRECPGRDTAANHSGRIRLDRPRRDPRLWRYDAHVRESLTVSRRLRAGLQAA